MLPPRWLYTLLSFAILICSSSFSLGQAFLFNRADFGPLGIQPGGIAIGDFNHDGKLDVAVTDSFAQTVTILLGQSNGTFRKHAVYPAGYEAGSVVTGDFNHDGKLDIVVADWVGSSVSVYLGKGDGTFAAPSTTNVPNYASEMVVADFNQDGKLDLAVTSNSASELYVLLGNGDGTLQPPVTYTTPSFTIGIVAQDFNRDGHIDLAVADTYGNDVYLMLGKGDGTFQPGISFPAGQVPVQLVAGDFNGDGLLDLVVTDGPDCGCAYMSVLLGNGDGTFQAPMTTSIAGAGPIVAGDFNRDHKLDIAIDNGLVTVMLGNGDGTFQPSTPYGSFASAEAFVAADINHDGIIDFIITNFNGNNASDLSTLLGNGDGTFGRVNSYSTGQHPLGIASADFNSDGKPDLATVNTYDNTVSVLLGIGGGNFSNSVNYSVSAGQAGWMAVADFNHDGHADIATTNATTGTVSILLNHGDGTFATYKDYSAGTNAQSVVAGDFNKDGNIDLIIGRPGAGLSLLLGNGSGGFAAPVPFRSGLSPTAIGVADFNGDGNLDLAVLTTSISSNSLAVLLGNGNGTFAAPVNYPLPYGQPLSAVPADFNHDGKIDVAVLAGATAAVFLGNGDGTFQKYKAYPAVNGSGLALLAADFTADGNLDLAVLSSFYTDAVYILKGDGKGHFGAPSPFYPGIGPASFVAADFDNNGGIDLAVTNAIYSTSMVTVILHQPVSALFPNSLKFAGTLVGALSNPKAVQFSNPGAVPVAIHSIRLSGLNAADFAQTNNCGTKLAVGMSCTVTITFQPTAKGARSATLTFSDNALSGVQTVSLSGTGK